MFGKPRVNGVPQFYPEANVSASAPVQTAEVIPAAQQSNGIAPSTNLELARLMPVMDIESAIARRRLIIDATANLMQEGVDYGKIPGAGDRLVLLQPGADKLCKLFGLVIRYDVVTKEEDWSGERHNGEPFFYYEVRGTGWREDYVAGEGIGSCNSWESKYRYGRRNASAPPAAWRISARARRLAGIAGRKPAGAARYSRKAIPPSKASRLAASRIPISSTRSTRFRRWPSSGRRCPARSTA